MEKGYTFKSETDTEVVPNLISYNYSGDVVEAINKSMKMLEGSYALDIICLDEPEMPKSML